MNKTKILTYIKSLSFLLPVVLISVFPILSFYTNNISELSTKFLGKPLAYSITISLVLVLFLFVITKNKNKSVIITSLVLLIFYSYGHLSMFLTDKLFIELPNGMILGPDKILIPIIFALFLLLFIKLLKAKKTFNQAVSFITITFAILVGYLALVIFINEYKKEELDVSVINETHNENNVIEKETPDIYHIILDGYARNDVLKEHYDYDNGEFTNNLEKMGFYVADKSRSNYIHTYLSLPSTFNMTYLDILPQKYGKNPLDQFAAINMMQDNLVSRKLKSFGYITINFVSDWSGTNENYIADINYDYNKTFKIAGFNFLTSETNMVFLQTTLLSPLVKEVWGDALRGKTLNAFEKLPDIPYKKEKKFILAHILGPHPPYVFTAEGNVVEGSELEMADEGLEKMPRYIDQLTYISNQILPILQKLIDNSDNPPIIILQADHGPASILGKRENWKANYGPDGVTERSSILYAIYLPDQNYEEFYQTITPVNTYRIIFNKYFDEDMELLPDKTYFTFYEAAYDFIDVTTPSNYF